MISICLFPYNNFGVKLQMKLYFVNQPQMFVEIFVFNNINNIVVFL